MAKRFTDSDKWKKKWIRNLAPQHKLFWLYILDDCDHAGIWEVDTEVASFRLGFDYDEAELLSIFKDKITPICSGKKWLINDFIGFQYGHHLTEDNQVHRSVLKILTTNAVKYPLQGVGKGLAKGWPGIKDKDKDKYKDKDKDKDKAKAKAKALD